MNKREDFKFEVCANGVESCIAAQDGGADRVELCAGIPEGGTTPSYGEILIARKLLSTTLLHVIIRPRGGDFTYSSFEAERMIADIKICKELGVDGVVFGCIDHNGNIDGELCKELLKHTKGMNVTFHRAFDVCNNPMESLEQVISLGFHRILSSGQQQTAEQGISLLKQLNEAARGRIIILAGCGVNGNNILKIYENTGIHEYHFSAREEVKPIDSTWVKAFGKRDVTTSQRVKETINSLIDN